MSENSDDRTALDRVEAAGEYKCSHCKDWGTIVRSAGSIVLPGMEPCLQCKRDEWLKWKAAQTPEAGDDVVVTVRCRVVMPSSVGLADNGPVQPCGGTHCTEPVVLVQPEGGEGHVWVPLSSVQIVTGV